MIGQIYVLGNMIGLQAKADLTDNNNITARVMYATCDHKCNK